MANVRFNGRWVLDTAEPVVSVGTPLRLSSVHYIGTSNLDECILHDGNGKLVWSVKLGDAEGLLSRGCQVSFDFGEGGTVVDGLDLDTISNGTLYIYFSRL